MAEVQTTRFGRYLQSLFNLKQALTLGEMLPDAIPTVELDNPRPENELFLGNDLCMGYGDITAAAGEFPQVSLGFPATPSQQRPGVAIVVEEIVCSTSVSSAVSLSFGSISAAAAQTTVSKLDTRRYQQAPMGSVRELSNAVNPAAFAIFTTPAAAGIIYIKGPFVLVPIPGVFEVAGLIVTGQTALTGLRAAFRWRERSVRADELIV